MPRRRRAESPSGRAAGPAPVSGRCAPGVDADGPVPGPDDRDPQPFGALTSAIAKQRGWSPKVSEGTVLGRWVQVVGEDIAAHAEPTGLRDGILSVSAESTAWATQLRMMQSQILAKIAAAVGDGVVKSLRITGPTRPELAKRGTAHPGARPSGHVRIGRSGRSVLVLSITRVTVTPSFRVNCATSLRRGAAAGTKE